MVLVSTITVVFFDAYRGYAYVYFVDGYVHSAVVVEAEVLLLDQVLAHILAFVLFAAFWNWLAPDFV